MALSPPRSRVFVVIMVVVMLGLAVLATILITRGMSDERLQDRIQEDRETQGR